MSSRSITELTQVRRKHQGRERSIRYWLERTVTNFCNFVYHFGKLLKRIFTLAFTYVPFDSKETFGIEQCHSLDNSPSHQRTETAHVEENAVVRNEMSTGELEIVEAKTHQSTVIVNHNLTKSKSMVTYFEEMVSMRSNGNLDDFIFDDNYFEDSWGLHSSLILATFIQHSLRVTTSCNISTEMTGQSQHNNLNTVYPEDIETTTELKYSWLSEEYNTLDETDQNMNEFSFSNSFFENTYAIVED